MSWGDNAACAVAIITIAELTWRFLRILKEYIFYSKHYPIKDRLRAVFLYGYTFSKSSCVLLALIAVVLASQHRSLSTLYEGIANQSYLLIIWWILRYTRFNSSTYDYSDWIRSDSGIDYATGMASNYFHGYLNLILPRHRNQKGLRERIEEYENRHGVQFAIKRLFLLFPNSLHSRPVLESRVMERENKLGDLTMNRAGVSRPYTNDVYRIKIDGKIFYITVEGTTPLLSYYEAQNLNLTSTWQMKAMQREIMLKFYRYLNKVLNESPETREQCVLLFYNDYTADGHQQDVGEVLCTKIKEMWKQDAEKQQFHE